MGNIFSVLNILNAKRQVDPSLAENLSRAALGTPAQERRIATVDRQTKNHGELALELGHRKASHVRRCEVRDGLSNAVEDTRPLKNLSCQCSRRCVITGY